MASNVTFTGADEPFVKSVILDGRRFPVGEEVPNVSAENIDRLRAIEGHHFRVTNNNPAKADKKEE